MSKQQPPSFTIKCQCSAYKNGLLITAKKKSKLSNLVLNYQSKTIIIIPLNSKDQNIVFELKRLKHIHRKYILEGKITLEFSSDIERSSNVTNLHGQQIKPQILSQIFVQAASAENLELLIRKIVDLKKEVITENKLLPRKQLSLGKEHITEEQIKNGNLRQNIVSIKRKQNYPKPQRFCENIVQRKKDPLKYNQRLKQYEQEQKQKVRFSRKQLMKQAYSGNNELQITINTKPIFKPQVDILQLPSILLQKIFEYSKVQLAHRLIGKKFDKFVLKNIQSLTFKDEVDDETFNKLAKYTVNIRGRLKNVRNLELIDLHDDRELQKNRSKSFYLGEWKQMSKKNIIQLKGLRVHTLQMPYQIKFEFHNIYGIRLKQLHLVSKTEVTTPNSLISDQNLLYLFKHVKELQAFSIPYINSSVLEELSTTMKEKAGQLKVLKIGSVNENCKKQESWFLFHIYEQLKCLHIERVLRGGITRSDVRHKFTFPLYIDQLQIGSIVSQETVNNFPTTLTRLKLSGQQYYNNDIANIYLPYLKVLDLSECPMVRPAVIDLLEKCTGLRMITNWDKQDVDYWKETAMEKDIKVDTVRGFMSRQTKEKVVQKYSYRSHQTEAEIKIETKPKPSPFIDFQKK